MKCWKEVSDLTEKQRYLIFKVVVHMNKEMVGGMQEMHSNGDVHSQVTWSVFVQSKPKIGILLSLSLLKRTHFCWLHILSNIWKITWSLLIHLMCFSWTSPVLAASKDLLTRIAHQMDGEWVNGPTAYCRRKASDLFTLINQDNIAFRRAVQSFPLHRQWWKTPQQLRVFCYKAQPAEIYCFCVLFCFFSP